MRRDRLRSFDEFWDHYQDLHRDPVNRGLHAIGTAAAVGLLAYALLRRRYRLLPLVPLVGYAPAWAGHVLVEGNRPATFGHPLWSLLADFRMLAGMTARPTHAAAAGDHDATPAPRT